MKKIADLTVKQLNIKQEKDEEIPKKTSIQFPRNIDNKIPLNVYSQIRTWYLLEAKKNWIADEQQKLDNFV